MIVLDTHVLVWWVSGSRRLSAKAARAVRAALRTGPVAVATVSVLEIATAVRRGRLQLSVPFEGWLEDLRSLPEIAFQPLSFEIAKAAGALGDEVPGDPADRIIAATAIHLEAGLVTADEGLSKVASVRCVW